MSGLGVKALVDLLAPGQKSASVQWLEFGAKQVLVDFEEDDGSGGAFVGTFVAPSTTLNASQE